MPNEERDVPELPALIEEIETTIATYDKRDLGTIDGQAVWLEIKNTILPLFRDLAMSVTFALEDLRDLADPIELSGEQAQEAGVLLRAYAESQPANPELQARIQDALGALDQLEDEDEGDEDDEEEA